jgi:hypothetical protein
MAFLDHNGESEFPFKKDIVFEAVCKAIPKIDGMKLDNSDKLSGRINVKAGVTLWSWGENIPIQLTSISATKTKVQVTSAPKTGVLFGGAFDMGKNRKNIERIFAETSKILSTFQPEVQSSETTNTVSIADELKKLKDLLENGILTEDEFIEQKTKLLK